MELSPGFSIWKQYNSFNLGLSETVSFRTSSEKDPGRQIGTNNKLEISTSYTWWGKGQAVIGFENNYKFLDSEK